jgi:hypothetical protein
MATASTWAPLKGDKRWAYLDRAKTIRVATTNEDNSIYLSPLWFVIESKRIFLPLDAGSRHGVNGEAGRPMSALVDVGDEYATVSGVRISGGLQATDDPNLVERLEQMMFDKYFHVGHPYAEQYFEFGQWAGRRYFEIVDAKLIGWDSRETTAPQVPEARVLPAHVTDRRI